MVTKYEPDPLEQQSSAPVTAQGSVQLSPAPDKKQSNLPMDPLEKVQPQSGTFLSKGEKSYLKDVDFLDHERGFVPDELKTFSYSAGESGLFGLPSLVAAANRYYSKNISWEDARKEQQEYIEALQRQHPNWSMAGTTAGIGASFLIPAGPIGAAARGAATGVEALGAGKALQTIAGGAGAGATAGAVSSGVEDYMRGQLSPESLAKGATVGGLTGGALAYPLEKIASKFVAPVTGVTTDVKTGGPILTERAKDIIRQASPNITDAEIEQMAPQFAKVFTDPNKGLSVETAREAILRASGITEPSATMATGIKTKGGTEARSVAEDLQAQAERQLGEAAKGFVTPGVSPTAGAEGVSAAGRAAYEQKKAAYGVLQTDKAQVDVAPFIQKNINTQLEPQFNKGTVNSLMYNSGEYDGANTAKRFIDRYYAPDAQTGEIPKYSLKDAFAIYQNAKKAGLTAAGKNMEDRYAVQAIADGYKDALGESILKTYMGNDVGKISALEALRADPLNQKYMNDLFPKHGADAAVLRSILDKIADTSTGRIVIDPNPSEGMLSAAQNVINANLLKPGTGRVVYDRLEQIMGANSEAMNNFKSLIRNQMMDVGNDFSKLSQNIEKYTRADTLPITLKAFGADAGNLGSLSSSAGDSAATKFAKEKVIELRRLGNASKIIYESRTIPETEKPGVFWQTVKNTVPSAVGFFLGGHLGSQLLQAASIGGAGISQAASKIGGMSKAAAERAGAPKVAQDISGGAYQFPFYGKDYTYVPGIRGVTALEPTEEPPNYSAPRLYQTRRASGGRVTTAEQLLAKLDQAEKQDVKETKSLLNLHDNTVAKALEIANKHI